MLPAQTVLNSRGEKIRLTRQEQLIANHSQRHVNSLGYEVNITTLTTIMKKITEQKFFEVAPADYLPVVVGEGAWSSNLTTYRSFQLGDVFETGILNLGGQNSRLASADAGVDALNILVNNWAKETQWTIMELQIAAKSGNWDLVSAKEEARKTNWDLGIQRVAFLGARGLNSGSNATCLGLLNQTGVTANTTFITAPISGLSTTNLKTFCAGLIEAYRSNCARTAWPTHFIIPESDYNGLASQSSPDFPIKSTLQVIEETFQVITRNKSFKILPLAYCDNAYSGLGVQKYVLLNYNEKSLNMHIPVDYTNTLANSINNFQFQAAAYGQFTGVLVLRPLEMMYFQY
jgi:hypothetical protein